MTAAPPNDASIHDESVLWRRIPPWHIIYDENLGRWRPSSSAFADDPDGQSMSVVLAEAVGGRSGAEILTGHEGFALAAVSVGVVRACGLGWSATPWSRNRRTPSSSVRNPKRSSAVWPRRRLGSSHHRPAPDRRQPGGAMQPAQDAADGGGVHRADQGRAAGGGFRTNTTRPGR